MIKLILSLFAFSVLSSNSWAAILVFSPNGTYTTKTTLSQGATAADAGGKTVVATSALSAVQSNISSATVHAWSGRTLKIETGGSVANTTAFTTTGPVVMAGGTFSGSGTVTINGPFIPGNYHMFAGTGVVRFGQGVVPAVNVKWFGATGDGTTDDYAALQAAFDCAVVSGVDIEIPAGTYSTTQQLTYRYGYASNGVTTINMIGRGVKYGGGLYTPSPGQGVIISYTGTASATAAPFGFDAANTITMSHCRFENITFNANGLAGYAFKVESTVTPRRENESNSWVNCLFLNATRNCVMMGEYAVSLFSDIAASNDININQNTFEHCLFYHAKESLVKMGGGYNIYNTKFTTCFFYWGNDSDYNVINQFLHLVGAQNTVFDNCFWSLHPGTAANDATDKTALLRIEGGWVNVINSLAEESRLLYYAGSQLYQQSTIINFVANDTNGANGKRAIYHASGTLTVENSSFTSYAAGTNYYSTIYSNGGLIWNNSYLTKTGTDDADPHMELLQPYLCKINGQQITNRDFLNKNFNMNDASGGAGPTLFPGYTMTALAGATAALSAQTTTYNTNGSNAAEIGLSVVGSGVEFRTDAITNFQSLVGKKVFAVATGYIGTADIGGGSDLTMDVEYSTGNAVGGSIYFWNDTVVGNTAFIAFAERAVVATDTMLKAVLTLRKTGTIYIDTVSILPSDGNYSVLGALSKYAADVKLSN